MKGVTSLCSDDRIVGLAVPEPTKVNERPMTVLSLVNTSLARLAIVALLLPAYNKPTGL